ncbi:glycosyltransferase family 4 protein [Nitrosomonas sp. Is24]|uniref:glycosyltransferase family 4 protein n=1 Tax=Nitrosomonas sp. Is24 TaxID=3080533 RepID=UPI00294B48FE|nr:glycosyltransferase family 4 protein [Nitrosomonas sp. Is24]MDV6340823.1 glycosyltransferase family 4 protein [Nitrosomonas sp. Is24]
MLKVLITGPSLSDQGGVAGYYNAVLPFLRELDSLSIHYMEIGSTKGMGGSLYPLMDQIRFRQALGDTNPSIVHVNPSLTLKSYIRDGLFIRKAKRMGYPVVVFFRGWDKGFESLVEKAGLWFFRKTYLKADAFIVLASAFRDKLKEWGVTVPVHLGTTTVSSDLLRDFSFTKKSEKLTTEPLIKVLFLARLEKEKGVIDAMEAVTLLRDRGKPVSLTVAGEGAAMDAVREYADRYDQSKEFLFVVGDVRGDKKRSLLASHHIFCFPSYYAEGMPNSVLEAMAFGMPVITCSVGGLQDFFEHEEMGYLVRQKEVADIMGAIEQLIDDRGMLKRMSAYNYHYAIEKFLAPGAANYLAIVYQQVAALK